MHFSGLLLLACQSPLAPEPPTATEELGAIADDYVGPWADGSHFPGVVVGILRGEDRVVRGYGETAPGSGVTPDADTLYEIGSLTKLYTGLLLAEAHIGGVARLEDPLAKHLSEDADVPGFEDGPIRLVDLSTHTSGLTRLPSNLDVRDANPYASYDEVALVAGLAGVRRRPLKSGRYRYSNFAVGALGVALTRARGLESYHELVRTRLAEPYGLENTTVDVAEEDAARLAPPFDAALRPTNRWTFDALAAAGAIVASADDVLTFAGWFAKEAPEELTEAVALASRVHAEGTGGPPTTLGWHVVKSAGERPAVLAHEGETGGYHSIVLVEPKGQLALVMLANAPTQRLAQIAGDVMPLLAGARRDRPDLRPLQPMPEEALEELPGKYRVGFLDSIVVRAENGALFVKRTGLPELRLHCVGEDRYMFRTHTGGVHFRRNDAGEVDRLNWDHANTPVVAQRAN